VQNGVAHHVVADIRPFPDAPWESEAQEGRLRAMDAARFQQLLCTRCRARSRGGQPGGSRHGVGAAGVSLSSPEVRHAPPRRNAERAPMPHDREQLLQHWTVTSCADKDQAAKEAHAGWRARDAVNVEAASLVDILDLVKGDAREHLLKEGMQGVVLGL